MFQISFSVRKVICFLILINVLISCSYDPSYKIESEIGKWEEEHSPLTITENKYIDSINTIGFELNIHKRFIGRGINTSYDVNLTNDSIIPNDNNYKKLIELRIEIAKELYSNVIEDSNLFDIENIIFTYELPRNNYSEIKFFPIEYFSSDTLQKWCGFKVIKVGENEYKRVKI